MTQRIAFAQLTIDIDLANSPNGGSCVTYTFRGDVDENFRQQDVPRIKSDVICLVLREIANFNSCGIREWINLIRDLESCGNLVFRQCSVTMVDQINLVPDTIGRGVVESFEAPYFCSEHGETVCEIKTQSHLTELLAKQAPQKNCPKCSKPLEFDALEESYFLFVEEAESRLKRAS